MPLTSGSSSWSSRASSCRSKRGTPAPAASSSATSRPPAPSAAEIVQTVISSSLLVYVNVNMRRLDYKWVALSNTTLGMLIATINASILLIALPDIFRGIRIDPLAPGNTSYLLWLILGFIVVMAVLLVSLGRLGDMPDPELGALVHRLLGALGPRADHDRLHSAGNRLQVRVGAIALDLGGIRVDGEDLVPALAQAPVDVVAPVGLGRARHARDGHALVGQERRCGVLHAPARRHASLWAA